MKSSVTACALVAAICAPPSLAESPAVPVIQTPALAIATYGELPGVEDMAISPDGESFAVIGRLNSQRLLVTMGRDRKMRSSSELGDAKVRYIRWAGNDRIVAVTSQTEFLGAYFTKELFEAYKAILITPDGSKPRVVFEGNSSIAKIIMGDYGSRLIDGNRYAFYGGLQLRRTADHSYVFEHGRPTLYKVDLATNQARKAAEPAGEGDRRDWLVDGSGEVAATLQIGTSGRWQISNAQRAILASGKSLTGSVELLALGRDGNSVLYSQEDDTGGKVRWYEVPLSGGVSQEVFADIKISRMYVDPANGRMLGYVEDRATPRPVLFDPARQAKLKKVYAAFPKLHVTIADWSADFNTFLVHTSGSGDSGTWYVVDVAKLRADSIGADYPAIAPEQVGPVSTVTYRASDGLEMDGVLTLPPGRAAKGLPVVLLPHGGPHARDEAKFDWWAQAFAAQGYAVFQPNFRGSTSRDDAFRRAGYGQWGRKMQTDISDGLAELARMGIVDAKRACIVGASYGGYAALAGVTLQKGLYRCAVAVAPVSDLTDMYNTDVRESGADPMVRRVLQESLGPTSGFAAVSPRRAAEQADAPILLIHGKDDTVVPYKQSTEMAAALKRSGKPFEMVALKEEDHWLSRSATRRQMLQAAVRFVATHNPS